MSTHKISLSIIALVCLMACSSCDAQNRTKNLSNNQFDPSVRELLGDSLCTLISSPKSVSMYIVEQTLKDNNNPQAGDTIKINKSLGKMKTKHLGVLQMLLQDEQSYNLGIDEPKCPFIPYLALKFKSNTDEATVLIAYNCHKWAFDYHGRRIVYKYNCYKNLVKLTRQIVPEDLYIQTLDNK